MIGNITPIPGKRIDGELVVGKHPDGQLHTLPVIVVTGKKKGKTLVVSANIHGDELTGIAVIHDLLKEVDITRLTGTLICFPTLNPTGLRECARTPSFDDKDPNRLFPDFRKKKERHSDAVADIEERRYPTLQEMANTAVYEIIKEYADCYIDLHAATFRSAPLVFIDPVFYKKDKREAQNLFDKVVELSENFCLPIVCEAANKEYFEDNMHRTSTGSVVNGLRIPAITVELGCRRRIMNEIVPWGVKGVHNVMRALGMIQRKFESIPTKVQLPKGVYRFVSHPRAQHTGFVRYLKEEGAHVKKGDTIASIVDIYGRAVADGRVLTEMEGHIMWIEEGHAVYPNTPLCILAVKSKNSFVARLS